MRKITMYACEICNELHYTPEEANDCESNGKEIPLIEIGTEVHEIIKMGGGWSDQHRLVKLVTIEDKGHYLEYKFIDFDNDIEDEEDINDYISVYAYGNKHLKEDFILK